MTTRKTYWTCQVAGWGMYSAAGMASTAGQIGWRTSLVAGYLLFALYSIALTELFRREIRRRYWPDARLPVARRCGGGLHSDFPGDRGGFGIAGTRSLVARAAPRQSPGV